VAGETPDKYDILVLDAESKISLTSARSLARAGLRVAIGGAAGQSRPLRKPPSWHSRYCGRAVELPDYTSAPAAFVDAVAEFARTHQVAVVLPVGDATVALTAPHRDRFAEFGCTLAVAPDAALEIATDKVRTLEVAAKLGIEYPRSLPVRNLEDLRAAEAAFGYPFVVKPSVSWTGQVAERVHPTEVVNEEEALRSTESYLATGCEVIAQQLASGLRESISLFIADSQMLAYCGAAALRTTPPLGGVSVMRESVPVDEELLQACVNLATAIGIEGACEVEFRRDASGQPLLMEINPRLAGTLENAMRAGVNFPLLIWQHATGQPVQPVRSYKTGVRTRWLSGDMRWAWDSMFQHGRPDTLPPARTLRMFATEFFRTRYYDYVDFRDMGPAWAEMRDTAEVIREQWVNRKQWRESGGGAIYISNAQLSAYQQSCRLDAREVSRVQALRRTSRSSPRFADSDRTTCGPAPRSRWTGGGGRSGASGR
jgi:predicted ATP-grasp superfamily ATP-dependent carboligase